MKQDLKVFAINTLIFIIGITLFKIYYELDIASYVLGLVLGIIGTFIHRVIKD